MYPCALLTVKFWHRYVDTDMIAPSKSVMESKVGKAISPEQSAEGMLRVVSHDRDGLVEDKLLNHICHRLPMLHMRRRVEDSSVMMAKKWRGEIVVSKKVRAFKNFIASFAAFFKVYVGQTFK